MPMIFMLISLRTIRIAGYGASSLSVTVPNLLGRDCLRTSSADFVTASCDPAGACFSVASSCSSCLARFPFRLGTENGIVFLPSLASTTSSASSLLSFLRILRRRALRCFPQPFCLSADWLSPASPSVSVVASGFALEGFTGKQPGLVFLVQGVKRLGVREKSSILRPKTLRAPSSGLAASSRQVNPITYRRDAVVSSLKLLPKCRGSPATGMRASQQAINGVYHFRTKINGFEPLVLSPFSFTNCSARDDLISVLFPQRREHWRL